MFPSGSVLVDELEGEADLLLVVHGDQGEVVIALRDEGLGMLGFAPKHGRGGGLDSGGKRGWGSQGYRGACWLLGLCEGEGKLMSCQDELHVYLVGVGDGGVCCCKSGGGVPGVVEEYLWEGWVCVGNGTRDDSKPYIELSINKVDGISERGPLCACDGCRVGRGEGQDVDKGGHTSILVVGVVRSGGGWGWCR